ncbi:MAG: hypothetical protein KUF77_15950 [Candidatus Thiodiazotropha sp. (ex Lucina aurantia)]|nr:hypothetical protein [Candidatus Thiodiazotropha sp. (ex Lucina pensylvanica)]MBT3023641.1 hypothetical protein [Candidatus Thiodiazotropha taylori]MBV2100789.1 hypothetical protein [Candidatus Thiodiazotropha sp. (ex Codakia orbicularis)]MBV2104518.1 hypothetical protein [Candidatus Thiodiazotropha sp. (ex Lucina aurantia)]MBV2119039.1 hypothetical protein [Candidatus Thiodiazotropha sp. (ex Lucina aurantia)]
MLNDLSKSIKASLYERAISPLFGAFVISWLGWNYRFVMLSFSSLPVKEKFLYIDKFLYPDIWAYLLNGGVYPLGTGILFILLYPWPAKWLYGYWHEKQQDMIKLKMQIEDGTPLTIEESRKIRRQMLQAESVFDTELSRRNSEIERLKGIIGDLEEEITKSNQNRPRMVTPKKVSPTKVQIHELNKGMMDIMKIISSSGGVMSLASIIEASTYDKGKTEYHVDELVSLGYLTKTLRKGYFELTTLGEKFALDQDMMK